MIKTHGIVSGNQTPRKMPRYAGSTDSDDPEKKHKVETEEAGISPFVQNLEEGSFTREPETAYP